MELTTMFLLAEIVGYAAAVAAVEWWPAVKTRLPASPLTHTAKKDALAHVPDVTGIPHRPKRDGFLMYTAGQYASNAEIDKASGRLSAREATVLMQNLSPIVSLGYAAAEAMVTEKGYTLHVGSVNGVVQGRPTVMHSNRIVGVDVTDPAVDDPHARSFAEYVPSQEATIGAIVNIGGGPFA